MAAASSITSGEEDLWTLARELQAPTKPLRDFMNIYLGSLLSSVAAHLNRTQVVAGLNIMWKCEYFLGGSTGNNTAVRTNASNDLDTLVVLTPSLAGYDVVPILVGTTFSLQVSPKPPGRGQTLSIEIGDNALLRLWTAFRTGVEVFAAQYRSFLAIKPVAGDGSRLVEFTENTDWQMRCSLTLGRAPVDVLLALQTDAEVHLILRRKTVGGGNNIVKSFSVLASRRLESLPEKGRQLISAMKHAKILHGSFKSPGCLFEAAVLEVFDNHEWIGDLDSVQLTAIKFTDVWKECWTRIRSWDPIAAPGAALSDENLLDWVKPESKAKLLELATHYQYISEAALLEELRPPGLLAAGPSQPPSGAKPQPKPESPTGPAIPIVNEPTTTTTTASPSHSASPLPSASYDEAPAPTPALATQLISNVSFRPIQRRSNPPRRLGWSPTDASLWKLAYELEMSHDEHASLENAFKSFFESAEPIITAELEATKSQFETDLKFFTPSVEAAIHSLTGSTAIGSGLKVYLFVNRNKFVIWNARSESASWRGGGAISNGAFGNLLGACDQAIEYAVQASTLPIVPKKSTGPRVYSLPMPIVEGGQLYHIEVIPVLQSTGPFLQLCDGQSIQAVEWSRVTTLLTSISKQFEGFAQVLMAGNLLLDGLAQSAAVAIPSSLLVDQALLFTDSLSSDSWPSLRFRDVLSGWFARMADKCESEELRQQVGSLSLLTDVQLLERLNALSLPPL